MPGNGVTSQCRVTRLAKTVFRGRKIGDAPARRGLNAAFFQTGAAVTEAGEWAAVSCHAAIQAPSETAIALKRGVPLWNEAHYRVRLVVIRSAGDGHCLLARWLPVLPPLPLPPVTSDTAAATSDVTLLSSSLRYGRTP